MRARLVVAVLAVVLCVVAPSVAPAAEPAAPLEQARAAYEQRAEPGQAQAAWDRFKQAATADTASNAARWEGARACYYLGEYFTPGAKDDAKMALFQQGIHLAKQAVALDLATKKRWLISYASINLDGADVEIPRRARAAHALWHRYEHRSHAGRSRPAVQRDA